MQRPETNMLNFDPSKPYTASAEMAPVLLQQGWVLLDAQALSDVAGCTSQALGQWDASWNDLPCDPYLKDQGRYRRRRHASLVVDHDAAVTAPHRAHWQPTQYNALHGGIHRLFTPMDAAMLESASFQQLVIGLGRVISRISNVQRWYVEAHQFRIDTTDGIGRPTPEGAHRDGVDFVAIIMIQRNGIKGGETRIFDAHGPHGIRLTLEQPWSALLLDDHAVIHETTPLQPLDEFGWRDTLVLTYRQGGFLEQR